MQSRWKLSVLIVTTLFLAACGAIPQSNLIRDPTSGSLAITVSGLPEEVTADISVAGPDGYATQLAAAATLDDLLAGEYTVTAQAVPGYVPVNSSQTVVVEAGALANLAVNYRPEGEEHLTGRISVQFIGQPDGSSVSAVVTGPDGPVTVTEDIDLEDMRAGEYSVTASELEGYTVAILPPEFDLTQGSHSVVTVRYAVLGGSDGEFTVDWPQDPFIVSLGAGFEFDVTFSSDDLPDDGFVLSRSGPANFNADFTYEGSTVHVTITDAGALPGRHEFYLAGYHYDSGQPQELPILVDVQLLVTSLEDSLEPEPGMLRYLIDDSRSEGRAISVSPELTPDTAKILLAGPLSLAHDLTIEGDGLELSPESGEFRVMKIEPDTTVIINNLDLSGGTSDSGGNLKVEGHLTLNNSMIQEGATVTSVPGTTDWPLGGAGVHISNSATAVMTNVTIRENRPANGIGGGIYTEGTLEMNDSVVRNNEGHGITSNEGSVRLDNVQVNLNESGTGIFLLGGETTIINSRIAENYSYSGEGGGIVNSGKLIISDTVLAANRSRFSGGGIANRAAGIVEATRVQFLANASYMSGGGIYNVGTFSLTDSFLQDNNAYNPTGESTGGGGGIMHAPIFGETLMRIERTTFQVNQSGSYGGAIATFGSLELTDSTVEASFAYGHGGGGGLYIGRAEGLAPLQNVIVTVTGSTFSDNRGDRDGGAISLHAPYEYIKYDHLPTFRLQNSTLHGNSAPNGNGDAIHVAGTFRQVLLTANTITENWHEQSANSGVHVSTNNTTLELAWNLFANNYWPGWLQGKDINDAHIESSGFNVFSKAPWFPAGLPDDDRVITDPAVASVLANNGGHTLTLLPDPSLASDSACTQHGFFSAALLYDQRGMERINTPNCTPGAVVLQARER